ncbi:hypothetical protein DSL72_002250 [Monilinia vaccinii-corymbosi]|uniref:Uncharacterized protein n=1 Tax=Monilinia vaccinii-corymbosi TaxID=61207 RepID=A0A8A3PC50_9HELO|nr:hypothetical protein DSL72_002250 [Monilinia vaccinii-corymbosi]
MTGINSGSDKPLPKLPMIASYMNFPCGHQRPCEVSRRDRETRDPDFNQGGFVVYESPNDCSSCKGEDHLQDDRSHKLGFETELPDTLHSTAPEGKQNRRKKVKKLGKLILGSLKKKT